VAGTRATLTAPERRDDMGSPDSEAAEPETDGTAGQQDAAADADDGGEDEAKDED